MSNGRDEVDLEVWQARYHHFRQDGTPIFLPREDWIKILHYVNQLPGAPEFLNRLRAAIDGELDSAIDIVLADTDPSQEG